MRVLLDTHSFLWYIMDSDRLSEDAEQVISDGSNEVLLSVGSLWEIAIKNGLGKLDLPDAFDVFITEQLRINRIEVLHIALSHLAAYVRLPFHHRDPFDRLLIAQAQAEGLAIVSKDSRFQEYGVGLIW